MIYCRWSPSLGVLEGTAEEVWGTKPYAWRHRYEPCVFFGLFDKRDYLAVWLHRGQKWVLWAGSDILALTQGRQRRYQKLLLWLVRDAEHWVEDEIEWGELKKVGIDAKIGPSFLGNVDAYEAYPFPPVIKVWVSAPVGHEKEYGWDVVERIAPRCPDVWFHLFGSPRWESKHKNVVVRGRVPKEQMNEECRSFHAGIRFNEFDGFSEVVAKSVLWGQYPISRVKHPHVDSFENDKHLAWLINDLKTKQRPNLDVRQFYVESLNAFPWNLKKH